MQAGVVPPPSSARGDPPTRTSCPLPPPRAAISPTRASCPLCPSRAATPLPARCAPSLLHAARPARRRRLARPVCFILSSFRSVRSAPAARSARLLYSLFLLLGALGAGGSLCPSYSFSISSVWLGRGAHRRLHPGCRLGRLRAGVRELRTVRALRALRARSRGEVRFGYATPTHRR